MDTEDSRYFLRGPIFRVIHLRLLPILDDYLRWDTVNVNTGKDIDRTGKNNDRTGNLSGAGMLEFAGWALDAGLGYTPMFLMSASAYLLALGWIHLMQPRLEVVNTTGR